MGERVHPRLVGTLIAISRYGTETADTRLDAEAVALGYAYRTSQRKGGMRLTRTGRRIVREADS